MESIPLNMLLFPLLAGYYATTRLGKHKFISQRLNTQAIFFNAILVGLPLLVVSLIVTTIITWVLPDWVDVIKTKVFPIQDAYFGTCLLSVILSYVITNFYNKFIIKDKSISVEKAIDEVGSELEKLVAQCFKDSELIQITLKNDKVYVGFAEILPEPNHNQYLQIVPLFSGYRDQYKRLQISNNYAVVYNKAIKQGEIISITDKKLNLVVLASDVISASRFDVDVHTDIISQQQEAQ